MKEGLVKLSVQKRRTGDDAVAVNKRLCAHRQLFAVVWSIGPETISTINSPSIRDGSR